MGDNEGVIDGILVGCNVNADGFVVGDIVATYVGEMLGIYVGDVIGTFDGVIDGFNVSDIGSSDIIVAVIDADCTSDYHMVFLWM